MDATSCIGIQGIVLFTIVPLCRHRPLELLLGCKRRCSERTANSSPGLRTRLLKCTADTILYTIQFISTELEELTEEAGKHSVRQRN